MQAHQVQYTIRNVPPAVDARLKAQARKRGLSLNSLLLDKLGAKAKVNTTPVIRHDLDFIIGSMPHKDADNLERVIAEARQADKRQAAAEIAIETDR